MVSVAVSVWTRINFFDTIPFSVAIEWPNITKWFDHFDIIRLDTKWMVIFYKRTQLHLPEGLLFAAVTLVTEQRV